jgi:hypothetical protein
MPAKESYLSAFLCWWLFTKQRELFAHTLKLGILQWLGNECLCAERQGPISISLSGRGGEYHRAKMRILRMLFQLSERVQPIPHRHVHVQDHAARQGIARMQSFQELHQFQSMDNGQYRYGRIKLSDKFHQRLPVVEVIVCIQKITIRYLHYNNPPAAK